MEGRELPHAREFDERACRDICVKSAHPVSGFTPRVNPHFAPLNLAPGKLPLLRMNTYNADDRLHSPGALQLVAEEGLYEAQEMAVRKRRCAGIFMKPVIPTHLHTCLLRLVRFGNLLLPGGRAGASAAL
jgi:hypothetical protein